MHLLEKTDAVDVQEGDAVDVQEGEESNSKESTTCWSKDRFDIFIGLVIVVNTVVLFLQLEWQGLQYHHRR